MTFPIEEIREALQSLVQNYERPILITSPTGSGKSTCLPRWLSEWTQATPSKPIIVVEPRRVACESLASFASTLNHTKHGEEIGHRIRYDDRTSASTHIIYMTPGIALSWLKNPNTAAAAILLDEFHERRWEVDFLAAAARASHPTTPLLLASATLSEQDLNTSDGFPFERVEASGRTFPIQMLHENAPLTPSSRQLGERVASAVGSALGRDDGDILVFLPGKSEISEALTEVVRALRGHESRNKVDVVEVHGSMEREALTTALETDPNRRRVYLSTNIAETSVTLPGVTTVIDSGLVRMRVHRGGRNVLACVPASEASMIQRAGRAGRVRAGVCHRLFAESYRATRIRPEVERLELDDLVVHLAANDMLASHLSGPESFGWPTPPAEFAFSRAVDRLVLLGVVSPGDHSLTELGARACDLPIGVELAALAASAPAEIAESMADLAALADYGRSIFKERVDTDTTEQRLALFAGLREGAFGLDEGRAAVRALRAGEARKHGLAAQRLREVRRSANQVRSRLGLGDLRSDRDVAPAPAEALARHVAEHAGHLAFVKRARARAETSDARRFGVPWSNGACELEVDAWSIALAGGKDGAGREPTAGVILQQFWMQGRGRSARGRGSILIPCKDAVLAECGIGTRAIREPKLVSRGARRKGRDGGKGGVSKVSRPRAERGRSIVATRVVEYAGVVLRSSELMLKGPEFCVAAAELIATGQLLPKWRETLWQLHHWDQILSNWPAENWVDVAVGGSSRTDAEPWMPTKQITEPGGASITPPEALAQTLSASLQLYGVEGFDDLNELTAKDLAVDVRARHGLTEYEFALLQEMFPRTWQHQGGTYVAVVSALGQSVTLFPVDKASKRGTDPPKGVLPKFGGFTVRYMRGSRLVTLR